jgi:hypothetical protein
LKTATLLNFHKILIKQKYRLLFSPKRVRRPGPKGPTKELIDAVVEMKRRNLTWGCKRIAQQVALGSGIEIDNDVVRRILGIHFRPGGLWRFRHGFPLLSCQRLTVVMDLFDVNQQYYERTGFWSSWINSPD